MIAEASFFAVLKIIAVSITLGGAWAACVLASADAGAVAGLAFV